MGFTVAWKSIVSGVIAPDAKGLLGSRPEIPRDLRIHSRTKLSFLNTDTKLNRNCPRAGGLTVR